MHPSQQSPESPPSNRAMALLLGTMATIGPFSIDTYLPSFLEIGARLGASQLAVQQTLTAYLVPFTVMTLWHGAISDAIGRRRVVLFAMGLFALASLGCASAKTIQVLWLFRALQGVTAGTGMVVGRAIIRDLFQGEHAHRLMAQVTMVFAIAPAVAPVIGGQLQAHFGWRSVFIFLSLFSAGLGLFCFFKLPETLPPQQRQPLHPVYLAKTYSKVFTEGRFVAACVSIACNFSGFFVYVASAPVFLLRHMGVKPTQFLWLFGPATTGMMLGAFLVSRVAGKLSHQQTIRLGFSLMGIGGLLNLGLNLLAPARLPWAVAPLLLYALGMTVVMPSLTLLALDRFPAQRGMASSCQGFIQMASNSLTAALIAPLVCATPLRLATGQMVFVGVGLAAMLLSCSASQTRE